MKNSSRTDNSDVAYVSGDGIGPEVVQAARKIIDAAVQAAYAGNRKINWIEVPAGESAYEQTGQWLPQSSIDSIQKIGVALKGPLTTPVGKGIRSLNVTLRQVLDLYANVRPVRHYPGVPSPLKNPDLLDVVIFRENTEDVYAGIEWEANSEEAKEVREFLKDKFKISLREQTGIGIKPISRYATRRIARAAINHAIDNGLKNLTVVQKGNIMKFTEGAFLKWSKELVDEEFSAQFVSETEDNPKDKIWFRSRIADAMFQEVLLRPTNHDVIVTTNLNGDYLSDACAAQVGGLGIAPGANIGDDVAIFEAVHGSAPKRAGKDMANPTSVLLSGCMMLDYLQMNEGRKAVIDALIKTIGQKRVTYDLARQISGATKLGTSAFGDAVIENLVAKP